MHVHNNLNTPSLKISANCTAMQPYQITSAFGDLFLPFLSLTFTTKVRRTADQMLSEST